MSFPYEDLYHIQFEHLVHEICMIVFGVATCRFSEGRDGGRDAKFVGTAQCYPSKTSPWKDTTIIQAKHTSTPGRSFSDADFFTKSSRSAVLIKESARIRALRETGEMNNYLLVSNRKLSAGAEAEIRSYLAKTVGLSEEAIGLCGVEQLDGWLKSPPFHGIRSNSNFSSLHLPLVTDPKDIARIIMAMAENKALFSKVVASPPTERVFYQEKNETNNMSETYARLQWTKYLKYVQQIKCFLAEPENEANNILDTYQIVVDEFQLRITSERARFTSFDKVIEHLAEELYLSSNDIFRQHKPLTRAMLFYMYWNCDIGEKPSYASTN